MGKSSGGGVVGIAVVVIAIAGMTGHLGDITDIDTSELPTLEDLGAATATSQPPPSGIPAAPSTRKAQQRLDTLTVTRTRPPARGGTYDRSAYGAPWFDVDSNGCKTRQDVLYAWVDKEKPYTARQQARCAHSMVSGTWVDPYTGNSRTFTNLKNQGQAQSWQIDHRVPLREAHESGAARWPATKKRSFANDPLNLVPTDGAANGAKSDKDPAAWKPSSTFQCDYAKRYISVKSKYQLTVDRAEKKALTAMLTRCN